MGTGFRAGALPEVPPHLPGPELVAEPLPHGMVTGLDPGGRAGAASA